MDNEAVTENKRGLAEAVLRFARFLKGRGFRVFQSDIHSALQALEVISLQEKQDFYNVLRANLVSTDTEWIQFESLFHQFWDQQLDEQVSGKAPVGRVEKAQGQTVPDISRNRASATTPATKDIKAREWLEGVAYSPVSRVENKAFDRLRKEDIQVAQLALKKLIHPFRVTGSRRFEPVHGYGAIDFRRTFRASLKTMGVPFELFYKRRKKRLKRLIILADVSGSMDRYARFVMPFLLGIRGVGARTEVFVFSTSLTRITFLIRHLEVDKALEHMAREVPEWSGGTRIGYSLGQFNHAEGTRFLNTRSVVVLLSDGWDLGGKAVLKKEMAHLSRKVHSVIWLNPLAGDPFAGSISQGMAVVLPYVDYLLPADSLNSLKRVGRLLSRLMIH